MNNEETETTTDSNAKVKANINTPQIEISVETESKEENRGVVAAKGANKDMSPSVVPKFNYCLAYFFNKVLSFSTCLFVIAVAAAVGLVLFVIYSDNLKIVLFLALFSIVSLILSVVVKLKTDDSKWIRLPLIESIISSFNKNEINRKDVLELLKFLEV